MVKRMAKIVSIVANSRVNFIYKVEMLQYFRSSCCQYPLHKSIGKKMSLIVLAILAANSLTLLKWALAVANSLRRLIKRKE